jgi:hypothetical protein
VALLHLVELSRIGADLWVAHVVVSTDEMTVGSSILCTAICRKTLFSHTIYCQLESRMMDKCLVITPLALPDCLEKHRSIVTIYFNGV